MKYKQGQIEGVNQVNETIWQIMPVEMEGDEEFWQGTGRNELFLLFPSLRDALNHFIGAYPGTCGVRSTLNHQYRWSDTQAAARKIMLDGILSDIATS